MCSGKGAGSPQGYNTGVVPPAGGMQQFANIQNQFQKSPWDATLRKPNTVMGSQPGLATTQPVSMYDPSGGTLGTGGGGPNTGYGTGGLDPNPRSGNPPMMPPVTPEMGLLGGAIGRPRDGQFAAPMQTGSAGTISNYNMTPELQAQLDKARSMFPAGAGPRPGGPEMGPNHTGLPGGNGGWANNQYNPANRDPNGPANRMAGAAAYQQSLTPEMLQQQINNGQRAPTSYTQMQGMINAMDPAARADYIAKYKARTGVDPTAAPMQSTPGNIFGN